MGHKSADFSWLSAQHASSPQQTGRVWFEVGHTYEPRRWKSGREVPEQWRIWVRGVAGADISALVDKVVFQLCPDVQFPFPKLIYLEAPYQLDEVGCAPVEVIIDIHLKCSVKPEIFQVRYGEFWEKPDKCTANSRLFFYDIKNRSEQAEKSKRKDRSKVKKASPRAAKIPKDSFKKVYRQLNETYRKVILEESLNSSDITHLGCRRCLTRVMPCPNCQPRRIPHQPAD